MRPLTLTPVPEIPLITSGDDLPQIILGGLTTAALELTDGDILVLAQKIVSKAENRMIYLGDIIPSSEAIEMSRQVEKDARLVELVLSESRAVLRVRPGTLIVEHRLGFVCANAGIDHSNVQGPYGDPDLWVLLLPENPDYSADQLRLRFLEKTGKKIGILIIDSHGRAWRVGTVGVAIGFSGMPGLVDLRGQPDIFGYQLRVTQIAAADELAAAASLVMGQADERTPVVHVRGFPYPLRQGKFDELRRPLDLDLFR
jgi:coenzyme F420-0:L-glutamate ligase / coenzyme F420-1:gamma-L-glutamate ligase